MQSGLLLLLLLTGQLSASRSGFKGANAKANDDKNDLRRLEAVMEALVAKNRELEQRLQTTEDEVNGLRATVTHLHGKLEAEASWNMETWQTFPAIHEQHSLQDNQEKEARHEADADKSSLEIFKDRNGNSIAAHKLKSLKDTFSGTIIDNREVSLSEEYEESTDEDISDIVNTVPDTPGEIKENVFERNLRSADVAKNKDLLRRKRDMASGRATAFSAHGSQELYSQTAIAFTAVVSAYSLPNIHSNQAIVFDDVVTNIGNAYNNATGVFTAPLSGIYAFSFAVMVEPGDDEYIELVDDGMRMLQNYVTAVGESRYTSSSRSVTLHVDSGSEIWVRAYHGSNIIHGNGYTTFSGWLISTTN